MEKGRLEFPEGFLWGAATSAHQVEGGNDNNDWWRFESLGKVKGGERSGRATDHYHLFEEDFRLAQSLGQNAHRLSIEWSRIEPKEGEWDEKEIEHYRKVLESARTSGLKTMVTLHHFTNPLWFAEKGGWEYRKSPELFARYAGKVAESLGEAADFWVTVNEPLVYVAMGTIGGHWPPAKKSYLASWKIVRSFAKAHRQAYAAIKRIVPTALVGIAQNNSYIQPRNPHSFVDRSLCHVIRYVNNFYFLDRIADCQDFIGLNHYFRRQTGFGRVIEDLRDYQHQKVSEKVRRNDLGWELFPEGLYHVAKELGDRYGKPIYITENGLADARDRYRPWFIRESLGWLHRAIGDGADVRGYFHWSLLDNFEWADGFEPRFGLVEVDYETLERRPRESARIYAAICRENALVVQEKETATV